MPSAGSRPIAAARRATLARRATAERVRLERHLANLKRLNDQLRSGALYRRVEARVNSSGAMTRIMIDRFGMSQSAGSPWQPLAPSTIRNRRFPGRPILVQTQRMMNSAKQVVRNTFKIDSPVLWEPRIAAVRTRYAGHHQMGTPRMPARPFMANPSWDELKPAYVLAKRFLEQEMERILGR